MESGGPGVEGPRGQGGRRPAAGGGAGGARGRPVVAALRVKGWRSYAAAEVRLGPGLTVVHGPNGAGKTNLLEALYFGCTGRSWRTRGERQVPRVEAPGARDGAS